MRVMRIEKLEVNQTPPPYARVKLKECGGIAEIRYSKRENAVPRIRKLDKNRYVFLCDTQSGAMGEIRAFQHNTSRRDDLLSAKESLTRLCDYINTNAPDAFKCRWLTLTYAENMTDPRRLYADFKAFNRKCRKRYGAYEYVTAAEPQARGAWHLHCLFIFAACAPFMANAEVRELWGNGFVNVRKLTSADNIGRYLTAYLCDMALDELGRLPVNVHARDIKQAETRERDGAKTPKAIIKGARLALYPPGFHLYRISKGIRPPKITKTTNGEAEARLYGWAKTYEATYRIEDTARGFENIVNKRYYRRQGVAE